MSRGARQAGERPQKGWSLPASNGESSNHRSGGATLLTVVVVGAVLYFARDVLIPSALAVLLAFLLAPLVNRLRRWGLGRVPSAVGVVLLSFVLLGVIGAVMASQLGDLAHKLPEYQHNIHQKLDSVRASGGGFVSRAGRILRNVSEELSPTPPASQPGAGENKPVPVEIHRSSFSPVELIQKVLGSLLSILVTAGIVIVFVLFILIEQEDLRDRLIRLAGARRLNVTTKVLDDAAGRLSRYLLAQLLINVGFGILAGVGLYFMKVPNPLLWGLMAALFRYVPYLGIWIAAIMPAAVAFAVEPGWVKAPLIFGLYFGIDLLMYNFAEPVLYGNSTGVSAMAILFSAVFWAWLWGPVGLLLATPLTVCLVVLGRHVRRLEFLSVLLSDEPVLRPETRFYQRLLARDLDEATEIAEAFLQHHSLAEFYDSLMIPALSLAEEDRHLGKVDHSRQRFIFEGARILIDDMAERAEELRARDGVARNSAPQENSRVPGEPRVSRTPILCLPARDEADELAALMLRQLARQAGLGTKLLAAHELERRPSEQLVAEEPAAACVFAVPPFGYTHARYACRQLHARYHELTILAAVLTEGDAEEIKRRQPPLPAERVASSLRQLLAELASVVTEEAHPREPAFAPVNEPHA